jgi:hypothetical protein
MHIQMTRLYEAARELKGITGQSDLARALNASPQAINNWEARGMSSQGMVGAQAALGCSATWLASGEGQMVAHHIESKSNAPMDLTNITYLERVDHDEMALLSEYRAKSEQERKRIRQLTGAPSAAPSLSDIRNQK